MERSVPREGSAASTGSQTPNGRHWGGENKVWSQHGEMWWTELKQMERQEDVDLGSREQPGGRMEMNHGLGSAQQTCTQPPLTLPRSCSHLQPYLSGCLHPLHRRSPPWPAGSTWRISCSCPGCWSAASAASPRPPGTAAAPRPTAPRWPRRSAWSLQGVAETRQQLTEPQEKVPRWPEGVGQAVQGGRRAGCRWPGATATSSGADPSLGTLLWSSQGSSTQTDMIPSGSSPAEGYKTCVKPKLGMKHPRF